MDNYLWTNGARLLKLWRIRERRFQEDGRMTFARPDMALQIRSLVRSSGELELSLAERPGPRARAR